MIPSTILRLAKVKSVRKHVFIYKISTHTHTIKPKMWNRKKKNAYQKSGLEVQVLQRLSADSVAWGNWELDSIFEGGRGWIRTLMKIEPCTQVKTSSLLVVVAGYTHTHTHTHTQTRTYKHFLLGFLADTGEKQRPSLSHTHTHTHTHTRKNVSSALHTLTVAGFLGGHSWKATSVSNCNAVNL